MGAQSVTRGLQGAPEVTVVTTAEQLKGAVVAGKPYIEIQAHLNLTSMEFVDANALLGSIPATVKSIRVRPVCCALSCICNQSAQP
jgi:hypothetical protein